MGPYIPVRHWQFIKSWNHLTTLNIDDDDDIANDGVKLFDNTTVTIINRSEVLGLPLATMLSNQGATVYSMNIDSILNSHLMER